MTTAETSLPTVKQRKPQSLPTWMPNPFEAPMPSSPAPPAVPQTAPTSAPAPPAAPVTAAPAPTTPAAPTGPVYGQGQYQGETPDFNRLGHGDAVQGLPGYSWYHNGSGWVQAPTGQDPHGATGSANAGKPRTFQEAYEQQLKRLLDGPTAEEAGAGAADSPEARAYRAAAQRSQEREIQQLAEDNAYGGGDVANAGLTNAKRGLRQMQGESEAQFLAKLTDSKIQQRRAELESAMQMAATKGDNEAARALQLQIAQIDAAARNKATDVQRELGMADVDVRKLLGLGDLDLRRYGIDVGRDTALDQLGFDYTDLQQRANRDTLTALGL